MTIRSLPHRSEPLFDTLPENKWSFEGFEVTAAGEVRNGLGVCEACGRSITYNYLITHPTFGRACVGMECVHHMLSTEAIQDALPFLHKTHAAIQQTRFRNRISKLRRKIPQAVMHAWSVEVGGSLVNADQALTTILEKLKIHIFLSRNDIAVLQAIEAQLP